MAAFRVDFLKYASGCHLSFVCNFSRYFPFKVCFQSEGGLAARVSFEIFATIYTPFAGVVSIVTLDAQYNSTWWEELLERQREIWDGAREKKWDWTPNLIQFSKDCSTKRFILFKSSLKRFEFEVKKTHLVLLIKCEVLLAIQTNWVFAGGHSFCNLQFYHVYTFKFSCALHCTYLIDFIVWPPQKLRLQILGVNVLKSIVDF